MGKGYAITRIEVSLPSGMLSRFDGIINGRGYSSRSEGVRDAIRAYITEYEQMERREAGEKIGIITYLYDHDQRGLGDELIEVRHRFRDVILSVHKHPGKMDCIDTVIVKGEAEKIKDLAGEIMSLKGVNRVLVSMSKIASEVKTTAMEM